MLFLLGERSLSCLDCRIILFLLISIIRLQEETAKVEEYLLDTQHGDSSFTIAIIRCMTISKANAFENLLEPLQKLLRLSPAIAATFARPDMFERIGQKLQHTKPSVRVNLLRILSTICDSSQEQCGLLRRYGLLDAIRELQKDSRVLVRELAGQLVKNSEDSDNASLNGSKRRQRRRSTSTAAPPSLISSHSMPASPQVTRPISQKPYYEGRESSRRQNGLDSSLNLRPGSRDGGRPPNIHPGLSGNGSTGLPGKTPRLNHRLSQQILPGSPQKEEIRTPTTTRTPSLLQPSSRRRRQTNTSSNWS